MNFNNNNFNNNFNNKLYLATKESSLNDPSYRYQIDYPIITTSGKHGNKTTWFENSESYGKSINRSSEYFTKYVSYKLACSSKFDKIKNCQTFKGEYSIDNIIQYLIDFNNIFVICKECDYPDTKLILDETKKILCLECESCGKINIIRSNDKTVNFIEKELKNKK